MAKKGYKKGVSGNPKGRPKGKTSQREQLLNAIRYVEGREHKKLLVHAAEKAYEDNTILIAIVKKLVPDLKAIEMTGEGGAPLVHEVIKVGMSIKEASEIYARLLKENGLAT